jgi:hypothetical protein
MPVKIECSFQSPMIMSLPVSFMLIIQILLIGSVCLWDCPLSYNFMNILPEDILLEKFSRELQIPLLILSILVQCWLKKSCLFRVEFRVRKKDLGFSS